MPDTIAAASALAGHLKPGRQRGAGVHIRELTGVAQLQVIARNGREGALAARIARHLGRKVVLGPLEGAGARGLFIAATGPCEYWVRAEGRAAGGAVKSMEGIAGDCASLFDQSHGRFVLGLAGDHAAHVLAKGTALDLRGPEFPVPGAAHTTIAHIPALVMRREADVFELSLARSYAGSFAVWLAEGALEYGCIVE